MRLKGHAMVKIGKGRETRWECKCGKWAKRAGLVRRDAESHYQEHLSDTAQEANE